MVRVVATRTLWARLERSMYPVATCRVLAAAAAGDTSLAQTQGWAALAATAGVTLPMGAVPVALVAPMAPLLFQGLRLAQLT